MPYLTAEIMKTLKLIGILALLVPAVLLLAFGPDKHTRQPADFTVVEYWEKWTGSEGDGIKETVDAFNATEGKRLKIYVNLLSTSGITQKMLVSTAGGVPPDIAGLWDMNLAQLAALGALEPLDDLAAANGIKAEQYKKVFWDECHYKGKLYALISTPYCYALHYNKKIFRENADKLRAAGCDPTRAPQTIEELDRYAKALDDIAPDGTIHRTGFLPFEPGWDIAVYPDLFGGTTWDPETRKFTYTNDATVRAFEWMQSYSKRLGKGAVTDFRSGAGNYDSPQNPFMAGTTAMVSQGTFFANIIRKQRPDLANDWAAAPLPTAIPGLKGVAQATSDVLCIPAGARHKKEAFAFMTWLQQRENMERLVMSHCKMSPLVDVSDNYLNHNPNPYIKVFEDLASGPGARGTPSVEVLPDVTVEMTTFVADVAAMRVEPRAGLEKVQQRMQAKYDNFVEKLKLWENN
ncbi:MAG: extracellular solute-binding protein [Tepidisphaeraceae bacterium]